VYGYGLPYNVSCPHNEASTAQATQRRAERHSLRLGLALVEACGALDAQRH
jgi:hypothetical protein